jgi:hypothetical protein
MAGNVIERHRDQGARRCIAECEKCHEICVETVDLCLREGGQHADTAHITLLLDCAQICQVSADYMLRGSSLHTETCAVCADVCDRCVEDCEKFGDEFMHRCAEACRSCAESCRRMAGGTHIAHAA